MESLERFFRKLVSYFYVPPVLVILFCLGACGTIMYNNHMETWGIACILLCFVFLAVQIVVFVAALFQRRWVIAILSFLALALTAVMTFLSIVGIAVGQHHPPRYQEPDSLIVDTLEVDSLAVEDINTATPPDSMM